MAVNEKTSATVAKIASKGLKAPGSLTNDEIKVLAASALTQSADVPREEGDEEEGEAQGRRQEGDAQGREEEAVRSVGGLRCPPLSALGTDGIGPVRDGARHPHPTIERVPLADARLALRRGDVQSAADLPRYPRAPASRRCRPCREPCARGIGVGLAASGAAGLWCRPVRHPIFTCGTAAHLRGVPIFGPRPLTDAPPAANYVNVINIHME